MSANIFSSIQNYYINKISDCTLITYFTPCHIASALSQPPALTMILYTIVKT